MQNKPLDVNYCAVNKEKILSSKPKLNEENLNYFYNWLIERYKIHIEKDIKKSPPPWTKDPILSKYRFTNVRREHDKETKWLIKSICENPSLNYENKILNIILFRLINKSKTFEIFGPINFNNLDLDEIKEKLSTFSKGNPKYIYFSNAFYTSGPKSTANKLFGKKNNVTNMIKLVSRYKELQLMDKIRESKTQKEVYETLLKLEGIGSFLAYQIFVDFTYLSDFPFSENEFVIAGPGCKNGLNLLFTDFSELSYEEALFWLRDNQNKVFRKFNYNPKEIFNDLPNEERHLNLMSLENCMCELSKYIRAIKELGRPR